MGSRELGNLTDCNRWTSLLRAARDYRENHGLPRGEGAVVFISHQHSELFVEWPRPSHRINALQFIITSVRSAYTVSWLQPGRSLGCWAVVWVPGVAKYVNNNALITAWLLICLQNRRRQPDISDRCVRSLTATSQLT